MQKNCMGKKKAAENHGNFAAFNENLWTGGSRAFLSIDCTTTSVFRNGYRYAHSMIYLMVFFISACASSFPDINSTDQAVITFPRGFVFLLCNVLPTYYLI